MSNYPIFDLSFPCVGQKSQHVTIKQNKTPKTKQKNVLSLSVSPYFPSISHASSFSPSFLSQNSK